MSNKYYSLFLLSHIIRKDTSRTLNEYTIFHYDTLFIDPAEKYYYGIWENWGSTQEWISGCGIPGEIEMEYFEYSKTRKSAINKCINHWIEHHLDK